jgi:hypothetical protein
MSFPFPTREIEGDPPDPWPQCNVDRAKVFRPRLITNATFSAAGRIRKPVLRPNRPYVTFVLARPV